MNVTARFDREARETREAPVMLANPDFYGTLAATRALGEKGKRVYIADHRWLVVSRWSRHTTRALPCPPMTSPIEHLDWLIEFGDREPGIVLYPTSDEATFLYSLRLEELAKRYRMYQPGLDAVLHVLDKKRMYASAREVGIEVPETWFPESDDDLAHVAREAELPLLVKPRTQILSYTHSKGVIVRDASELASKYHEFVRRTRYHEVVLEHFPEAARAMVQRYVPEASSQIYVLAAFLDASGRYFAARSALKIFQRPRSLGIGLCFEHAPLDPALSDAVRRLALKAGYFGVFQLEFIKIGNRYLLIDFNPRFYNQLAFDIARGLPLPHLVYAAATGDEAEVARLAGGAEKQPDHQELIFCNRFGLEVMLSTQRLVGQMSAGEAAKWRSWYEQHQGASIDPTFSPGDPLPVIVDLASQLYGYARHPRAFLRNIVLDQSR